MDKLILFFLILQPALLFSQTIFTSEGIPLRTDMNTEIIGKADDNYLLFVNKTTTFELHAFNDEMRHIWDKELELEKRSPKVIGLSNPDNRLFYLFYIHRVKNHPILKVNQYDSAGVLRDSSTIIDLGVNLHTPSFTMILSEDKTKVLLYEVEGNRIKQTLVFDTDTMQLVWEDDLSKIELRDNQDLHHILVDNDGNAYLMLCRDNFYSKNRIHHYEIYERNVQQETFVNYKIGLNKLLTYSVYFEYDNLNKAIIAGGMYSEKNRGRSNGFYYINIPKGNPDQHVINFTPFDEEFTNEFLDKAKVEKKGIIDTDVQELVLRRDGGILMIGERNKNYFHANPSYAASSANYRSTVTSDYYYNDLFVISIHPDGKLHWREVLHKKQYSFDDAGVYSSYFLLLTPSSLRFLFNDEIKSDNTVSEYIMKGNGSFERNSIMNTEDQNLRLRFRDAVQVGARELIVPSERRNRLRLVKISY